MPEPYARANGPALDSVPLTVIVLSKNEEPNITRCLSSVAWADQVVVVDSGSTDDTVQLARSAGAEVVITHWRGFGPQREYALRLPILRHDWVFFVDADEWVSRELAVEVSSAVRGSAVAYWLHVRLIFQGKWIRHCGWYPSARLIRLMRRSCVSYPDQVFSEHPVVAGSVERLRNDLVDEDLKGLSEWLHKHVRYAGLEAERRTVGVQGMPRRKHDSRIRAFIKDTIAPNVPARPLVQFIYMYLIRRGFLDGRAGISFCFYHAWFQVVVKDVQRERIASGVRSTG